MTNRVYMQVALSRVAFLSVSLVSLLAATWFFSETVANQLLQISAVASLVAAATSLGSNGFLSKALVPLEDNRAFGVTSFVLVVRTALAALLLAGVALVDAMSFGSGWFYVGLLISTLSTQVTTLEFHAERSTQELTRFSQHRTLVVLLMLPLKIGAIASGRAEAFACVFLSDGLVVSILFWWTSRCRILRRDVLEAASIARRSWLVWLSAMIQIGWTRAFFVVVSGVVAPAASNTFFLVVRVIEALVFLPNSISSSHNEALVREYQERCQVGPRFAEYQAAHFVASLCCVLLVVAAALFVMITRGNGVEVAVLILVASSAFFFYLRSALSRYIVLSEFMIFSPASYVFGAMLSAAVWSVGLQAARDLYVFYFMVQLGSVVAVVFAWRRFRPFFGGFIRLAVQSP